MTHRYFDYVATHPHDGYFTIAATRALFAERSRAGELEPGFELTFACDNGMIGAMWTMALSKLKQTYQMKSLSIIPLAAYHAYSLCDSHGGHFKPILNRLACGDNELDLDEIKQEIEQICDRTEVTVLAIDDDAIDTWLPAGGKPRAIRGVRAAGQPVHPL